MGRCYDCWWQFGTLISCVGVPLFMYVDQESLSLRTVTSILKITSGLIKGVTKSL